ECEFRGECRQTAEAQDALTLLPGMREKEVRGFEAKGLTTITQLSHTFRARRRPKSLRDRPYPYNHALRALAVRENRVHVLRTPTIPKTGPRAFLDMEGDRAGRHVYLVGVLLEVRSGFEQHSFWADPEEGEDHLA